MSRIPFPGIITDIQRQNLGAVEYSNPINYILFDFKYDMQPKQLITLPINSMVARILPVYIANSFNVTSRLEIGVSSNAKAFAVFSLNNTGNIDSLGDAEELIMIPLTEPKPVIISLSGSATTGSGWGLFEWLNLSLIPRV